MDPLLLVVDDERQIRTFVGRCAQRFGFRVVDCEDGQQALTFLDKQSADMVIVDLRMPLVGGLDVLRAIRQKDPHCEVVLMSGAGTISDAVEAIKLGAREYLEKPFEMRRLERLLVDARESLDKRRQQADAEAQVVDEHLEFCGMIGRSPAMQELFASVRRLAPHVKTALVTGESGTGKELVARALHQLGARAAAPFVTVSCAGATEALAEGELFGHVRGAFAGAVEDQPGLIESADGGVLFLDEIGELPLALQGRLLRFLEQGEVHRLGAPDARRLDVAVVASTRRDLRTEMMAGRFRHELYYRLSSVEIEVPPLRARIDDIPDLAMAFIRDAGARMGRTLSGPTAQGEAFLRKREWRGNVRELRNTLDRACMLADGDLVTERELAQAATRK